MNSVTDESHPTLPAQVYQAVNSFAPHPTLNEQWYPYPVDGNYDAGKGEFLAQGTPQGGAFVSIRHDDCTDDTVAVRIRIPGERFKDTKSEHDINYVYKDGQIYCSGDWPEGEGPPLPGLAAG